VNERQAEKVSRTLSDGAIHCPVEPDIVRLGVLGISKLKVGPYVGHVRHCPVRLDTLENVIFSQNLPLSSQS
jgi:hypothetical protein